MVILPSSFSNKAPVCSYFITALEMVGLMAKEKKKKRPLHKKTMIPLINFPSQ
jgi:hypothetical protein